MSMPTKAEKKRRAAAKLNPPSSVDDPVGQPAAILEWGDSTKATDLLATAKHAAAQSSQHIRAETALEDRATRSDSKADMTSPVGRLVQRVGDKVDDLGDKISALQVRSSAQEAKIDKLILENKGLRKALEGAIQALKDTKEPEAPPPDVPSNSASTAAFGLRPSHTAISLDPEDISSSESESEPRVIAPPLPPRAKIERVPSALSPVAIEQAEVVQSVSIPLRGAAFRARSTRSRGVAIRGVSRGSRAARLD